MVRDLLMGRILWAYNWVPKCTRLLEVGGSKGEIADKYRKKAKEVYMIEMNKEYVKECQKTFPKVHAKVAPGEKIPFKDGFFDVVVMTDTLEHVQDDKKTISEVHRVLKKGGILVISTPHKGILDWMDSFNLKYRFPRLYRLWKGKEKAEEILKQDSWHRHYSLQDYEHFFKNKFSIQKVHRGGFFIWYFLWVFGDAFIVPIWDYNAPDFIIKPIDWLTSLDYAIPYGSLAAHIIIQAKKT